MKPMFDYSCLPTGIGSLPHTDIREATEFIFRRFHQIPHWAQLPHAGKDEGFISQFIGPLTKLGIMSVSGDKVFFDTDSPDWGARLAEFYNVYLAAVEGDEKALQYFAFPLDSAKGYYDFKRYIEDNGVGDALALKGQISGPLSVGFALTDQNRRAAYYDPQIRDVLIKVLSIQGKLQALELKEFGLPVIMFIDDPQLYACGMSTHVTLKKEEIINEINDIAEQMHLTGATVGAHSCAGMDWTILMESSLDIISFDAYEYFTSLASYVSELKSFIDRGGVLAWGIIPTSEKLEEETDETVLKLFNERLEILVNKGLDRNILLKQAIITPSCGTGILSMELAEKVYDTTVKVAEKVRRQL